MKRILVVLLAVLLRPTVLPAQGLLPALSQPFIDLNSGVPIAGGFICTTASGSMTPLATYSDVALTHLNPNPIQLNNIGIPVDPRTGAALTIVLQNHSYRFTVSNSTITGVNVCNGTNVGVEVRRFDPVIPSGGTTAGVSSITGTANQIICSPTDGAVTCSTPQNIAVTSSPTFVGETLSGLTPNGFLYSGAGGALTTTTAPINGQLLIGSTGAAPVAATLTAGSNVTITNGAGTVTIAAAGSAVSGVTGTTNQITCSPTTGSVICGTPQDIAPASAVTFSNVTDSALTSGRLVTAGTSGLLSNGPTGTAGQYLHYSNVGGSPNLSFVNPVVFSTADYKFGALTPGGSLSNSGGTQTITLAPCPIGVAGADTNHYLYVSGGTGTDESVLINGGTCTSGSSTGTITIAQPVNNHSGAWMIQSATSGLQEAILQAEAVGGGTIKLPGGAINSFNVYAPTYIAAPTGINGLTIQGAGEGSTWVMVQDSGLSFHQNYYVFDVVNTQTVNVRDLYIYSLASPQTGGGGIRYSAPSGYNNQSHVSHVSFQKLWDDIEFVKAAYWTVEFCTAFTTGRYGVWIQNTDTPDAGSGKIVTSEFDNTGSQGSIGILAQSGGGIQIIASRVNGFPIAFELLTNTVSQTGQIILNGNAFDGFSTYGAYLGSTGGGTWYSVLLQNNYFAGIGDNTKSTVLTSALIKDIVIQDNIYHSYGSASGEIAIEIDASNGVRMDGNLIEGLNTGITNLSTDPKVDTGLNTMIGVTNTYASSGTVPPGAVVVNQNPVAPPATGLTGVNLWMVGQDAANDRLLMDAFGSAVASIVGFRRARGTGASPAAVLNGDGLGSVSGFGYGATGYSSTGRASVTLQTTQDWTDSNQGAAVLINTTPNNSTTTATGTTFSNGGDLLSLGTIRANTVFNLNGSDGISGSIIASGSCTLTVSGGIITGKTGC